MAQIRHEILIFKAFLFVGSFDLKNLQQYLISEFKVSLHPKTIRAVVTELVDADVIEEISCNCPHCEGSSLEYALDLHLLQQKKQKYGNDH